MSPGDDEMNPEEPDASADQDDDENHYPWEDVEASRRDQRLQRRHADELPDAMREFKKAHCPGCGRPAAELACFYFQSPEWTWAQLCGAAGWMRVCEACHRQVEFVFQLMS
jgi:hypothetical protein